MSGLLRYKVGKSVKLARQQKGLTQESLSQAINKAVETISNIERGKTAPSLATLEDISNVLGLPVQHFVSDHGTRRSDGRQALTLELASIVEQLSDDQLLLLIKLGVTLAEHK